ncbi:MAG: cupredoxin domain-containing protein [Patescibacteria group bacterium]
MLALVLSGCTLTQTKDEAIVIQDDDTQIIADDKAADDTMEEDSNLAVKEVELESFTEIIDGKYFPQFSVKEITVKKGQTLRLKINTTSGMHSFKIDELDVFSETPTGEVTTIEFTPDQLGEFVYYCAKSGHRALGHWGTLKVVE